MSWVKMKETVNNVGLVGCGRMGSCMLEAVVKAGYTVFVYDAYPEALERAVSLGAKKAVSPKDVAEKSDLILLSLPGPNELEKVLFGEDGVAKGIGKGKVVVDTSTVDPESTKNNARRMMELAECAYLDCPILGRPSAVGKWMLPSGGDSEALAWVEPILLTFASSVIPVGDSGSGNALKLLNQMMFSCINAISCETMAIAESVGIDKKIYSKTIGDSCAATNNGLFREVTSNINKDDFVHPAFTIDLLIKDTKLALQMAKAADAPSVIASTVQIFNELAHAEGIGNQDTSALYKCFRNQYRKEMAQ